MSKQKRERLFSLHSLLGICVAFILYIVCFSGTFALFSAELTRWENPNLPVAYQGQPQSVDAQYTKFMQGFPDTAKVPLVITYYPTDHVPYYKVQAMVSEGGPPRPNIAVFSAQTGEKLNVRGTSLSQWMAYFHTDLWLPYPFGRSIIGLTGLFLLLLVISGLYMNNKLVKRSFLWRPDKSLKLLLLDSHNMLGLWGFLFHGIIAFSGAILGISTLLGVVFGAMVLPNGEAAHMEPLDVPHLESQGQAMPSISPDDVLEITNSVTGKNPSLGILIGGGQDSAVVRVYYEVDKPMVSYGVLDLKGATGEVIAHDEAPTNAVPRLFISVRPLHVGSFGGVWVKILYGVLGTLLCLIIISGLMMWLERKASGHRTWTFAVIEKLTIGVCVGFPLATVLAIYVDQIMVVDLPRRAYWLGLSVFAIWGGATMLASVLRAYTATRLLLFLLSMSLLGLPVLNLIKGGGGNFSTLIPSAVFLAMAGIFLWIAKNLPKTLT